MVQQHRLGYCNAPRKIVVEGLWGISHSEGFLPTSASKTRSSKVSELSGLYSLAECWQNWSPYWVGTGLRPEGAAIIGLAMSRNL